ncbi:MAG: dipeptidase PepE [Gemmatimonas sp.]
MRVTDNSNRRLLLLSNSRDDAGRFLQHTGADLASHVAGIRKITFVPYAAVTISWDAYTHLVRETVNAFGFELESVHETNDPRAMIENAEAIAVGGGNTFHLLAHVQRAGLLSLIRARTMIGVPYIGWSAGSVIAAPTMQTTNDMPITQPDSFVSLGLIGFQINAHFTDTHPPGFQGETRRQRLGEYVAANPTATVIGLPEGTWLRVNGSSIVLRGRHAAPVFQFGTPDVIVDCDVEIGDRLER